MYLPTFYEDEDIYNHPIGVPFIHACLVTYPVKDRVFEVLKVDDVRVDEKSDFES